MAALYQLSYVGAIPNPSVIAADPDMIGARNDHKCPAVPGGVFLAVLGRFRAILARNQPLPVTTGAENPDRTGLKPIGGPPLLSMVRRGLGFESRRRLHPESA
jgi:hypothetical protein